jgi:hypothetical protein
MGDFFREAAVLVCVFANLDRVIGFGRMSLSWAAGTVAATLLLLTARFWLDAMGEE